MFRSLCMHFASILATGVAALQAAEQAVPLPNLQDIRVVPVDPTPESESVEVRIVFPEGQSTVTKKPVDVQVQLDGYPLRTYSQFSRAKEIMNNDQEGQSLRIVVDNQPFFDQNRAVISDLENVEEYYEQVLEFSIPWDLTPGMHILRMFPVRSFGESLKGDGCFTAITFYYQKKTPILDVDLLKPYLTYNEPQGEIGYKDTQPVLLDFFLTNVLLSRDGYKVRMTIDGKIQRILTKWIPYYIYGLRRGKHTCKLELLNEQNRVVPGAFNTYTGTFFLK